MIFSADNYPVRGRIMVDNIKDASLTDYSPPKVQRPPVPDSVIDHKDLKGILFLGVKGDINVEVSRDDSKLDFLV